MIDCVLNLIHFISKVLFKNLKTKFKLTTCISCFFFLQIQLCSTIFDTLKNTKHYFTLTFILNYECCHLYCITATEIWDGLLVSVHRWAKIWKKCNFGKYYIATSQLRGTVVFTANNLKFFSSHDFSLIATYLGWPLASGPTQAAQKGKIMSWGTKTNSSNNKQMSLLDVIFTNSKSTSVTRYCVTIT